MGITIIGLGPGNGRYLTREAWERLRHASHLFVRTSRHPAVADLPASLKITSFDSLYDTLDSFETVYTTIVAQLLSAAAQPEEVLYAVPGHPFVGEASATLLIAAARERNVPVTIIDGLSFVEPSLSALNHHPQVGAVDGMENLQVCDALSLVSEPYPPVNPDQPALIGQVYSPAVAAALAEGLQMLFPGEHTVSLLHHAGDSEELVELRALEELAASPHIDHLTSLFVPPLPEMSDISTLANVVAVLRGPEGCPWDQAQTPQSLRDGLLEEASEVLDALDRGDTVDLREELGDLLLHIVMQTQMGTETGEFTLSEVIAGIVSKLIRRHPHVWGDVDVADPDAVVKNWAQIKREEKNGEPEPDSVLHNIPVALPALARSQKIQKRVSKVGFDWASIDGVYAKLQEELAELQAAQTPAELQDELGDVLFVVVNLAKWLEVDAEIALREANAKFMRRFRLTEGLAERRGWQMEEMAEAALIDLWNEGKAASDNGDTGADNLSA